MSQKIVKYKFGLCIYRINYYIKIFKKKHSAGLQNITTASRQLVKNEIFRKTDTF